VRTVVRIAALNTDARRDELAAIAGGEAAQGEHGTAKAAYDFADSLLEQAATLRDRHNQPSSDIKPSPKKSTKTAATAKTKTAAKTVAKPPKKQAKKA
jgi:DNA repair protein RecN (Recombination protein N)